MILTYLLFLTLLHVTFPKPITTTSTESTLRKHASLKDRIRGCNLNICFAIDGSGTLTPTQYNLQKTFIFDILSAIAGNQLELSATQYGSTTTPISPLTTDIQEFILSIDGSSQNSDPESRVVKGLKWCHDSLLGRFGEAGKVVVLGGSGFERAGGRARLMRRDGLEICVVGVGKLGREMVEVAGGRDRVFMVDGFFELADVVEELVEMVCGTELL